jgi:hypothetical protein
VLSLQAVQRTDGAFCETANSPIKDENRLNFVGEFADLHLFSSTKRHRMVKRNGPPQTKPYATAIGAPDSSYRLRMMQKDFTFN